MNTRPFGISSRAQSWLVMAIIAISLTTVMWYIVPYIFNGNNGATTSATTSATKESFNDDVEKTMVNTAKSALASLTESDQRRVCASTVSLVSGYRSLFSGASFKLQESSEGSGEYFLYGPDMRVVQVATDGAGALSLAIRNENPTQQLFVREVAIKNMDGSDIAAGGNTCYVFSPKTDPNLALQYEHQHLSLRQLPREPSGSSNQLGAPKPYVGQCFIKFQATEEELNATAVATGLGIPTLTEQHLHQTSTNTSNGNANDSRTNANASTGVANNTGLAAMTREIEQQARTPAVRDYAEYQNNTGGPSAEVGVNGNPFANKPIKLNLNLGGVMGQDSFTEVGDNRNPSTGGATNVRALLDKYTSQQLQGGQNTNIVSDKELAINKAYLAGANNGAMDQVGGTPVGCPAIDRSQYYTDRQLAQCAGCTPDEFMRG